MSILKIAIIGGTGFAQGLIDGQPETIETEYGQARVTRSRLNSERELIFLARHGAGHTLPPHRINHRANIRALQSLDVSVVFATAAVGSLQEKIAPGHFVVLDDFIDLTKGDVVTFFDQPGQVRHTDFGQPYDAALRTILLKSAKNHVETIHPTGTYLCLSGPRYETPAEVRLFSSWGADVVGMTGAPEATLCREAGLPYASVAIATNYGCGLLSSAPLSHTEVEQQMAKSREILQHWLLHAANDL